MKTREELKKYLSGEGIEIGALQNPLDISGLPIKKIRYVDRLSVADLRSHYPELDELPLVDPDILDDGQKLENIEHGSLDFIIANHLIEHVNSPLLALENWSKKLKEGGTIFMAVPDKRFTFDQDRPLTPLSHLIDDFQSSGAERNARDFEHFLEWTKIIGKKDGAEAESGAKKLHEESYSIHYHVWTFDSFVEVLRHAIDDLKIPFEILDYSAPVPGNNEFIFILRKNAPAAVPAREITDVVIPVYNGYSFFRDCFQSLVANTPKGSYRVVIVDDCSTEKEILEYFEEIEKIFSDSLVVLRNAENLGFVGSVNRGMKYDSKRDVVLLNSDTAVTKNWLMKLRECAYRDEKIATVTPLTNNGTICSVPNWLKDNRLPDGHSLESFAEIVEKSSARHCLELPTAVGFCMFIKRKILEKIGFFDEESYGKGYGEENDFSMRAKKNGCKNVLDDATFIHHKGHMSFSTEDFKKLTQNNSKVLLGKYPSYEKEVCAFIEAKPLSGIIDRIQAAVKNFQKNNILYFIHSNPYIAIGGSEKHTLDMVSIFKDRFNFVYLLYFDDAKLILERISRHKGRETVLNLPVSPPSTEDEFNFSEINRIFEDILNFYNIDIVHFQHLLNLPFSLIETARKNTRKIFITAHDYYLYCPHPHLLQCGASQAECVESGCADCGDRDINPARIASRRMKMKTLLTAVKKIIFPSGYIRGNFAKFFPELKEKFATIEHPYPLRRKNRPARAEISSKGKLNLAFLGYFSKHKGSEIFKDFVLQNKNRFNFFILGRIEDQTSFRKIKGSATQLEYANFAELESLINTRRIDIVMLLSVVPESFSFTLTESILLQIPLVASNIGVFPERMENTRAYELFDLDSSGRKRTAENLSAALERLIEKSKKRPAAGASPFNLDEYNKKIIKKYLDLYSE